MPLWQSPCGPEAQLLRIQLTNLQISKVHPLKPRGDQLESKFLEAKDLADEDSALVPTDVSGVVHSPQQKSCRIGVLRRRSWQTYGTGMIQASRGSIIQTFMWSLVVEHIAKTIKPALLRAKRCCGRL
jgi:hypothetical protein